MVRAMQAMRSVSMSAPRVVVMLLLLAVDVARAGDAHYAFDDYVNLLPLPNGPTTNGTTLLTLSSKLEWTITQTNKPTAPPPDVLVAATQRYSNIIFAWGAPTVPPRSSSSSSTTATLKQVVIQVDDGDDTFKTLQLGMDESYTLDVPTTGTATIRAPTVWGVLRALETLAQLIEYHPDGTPMASNGPWGSHVDAQHQKEYTLAWAPWHIADAPRFQHRGLMLDTARHWFTVPGILRQFDAMAAAKMNTMHWHITDGNSVPIESKLFPALNKNGAYNPVTMVYTQENVKTIVDYARHRGIRVVPEFDMPGHSDAWALGAPEGAMVLCPKMTGFGNTTGKDTMGLPYAYFDATSEVAYTFIDSFLGEMAGLFPDKVLHLGGDEVGSTCYNESASVQAWLSKHPGVVLDDLIPMFSTRVHKIAAKHGRSVMNWEETFEEIYLKPAEGGSHPGGLECYGYNASKNESGPGGAKSCVTPAPRHQSVNASLPSDAIVHAWMNQGDVLNAQLSATKFRSISSMGYYFSAMAGLSTWEYVYNTDPACIYNGMCLYDLPTESQKAFLGVEAAIWSEEEDENTLDKYWTTMSLLGERLWSQNKTILAHGDAYPPGAYCKATNKVGCCPPPPGEGVSLSGGCANYLNPSINSRQIKHRCRLEQRGFRPKQYNTDILSFESKWMQCASWLPANPSKAAGEGGGGGEGGAEHLARAEEEEEALLARLEAAGVSVKDLEAVKALVNRAHAREL